MASALTLAGSLFFSAASGGNARTPCHGVAATIVGTGSAYTQGIGSADVIVGTSASETIDGRGGDDVICGEGGDDLIASEA